MSTEIREIEDKETIVNRAVDKFIKAVTGVHLITSELLRNRHATTAERELLKAAKVQLKLAELALDEEERAVSA